MTADRVAAPANALERLRALHDAEEDLACTIADALGSTQALDAGIRAVWPGARLVGRAVTARADEDDLAAVFSAIDAAGPGDVVVIEGGESGVALWGENTSLSARNRGVAGAVLAAPVRDHLTHQRLDFALFAAGVMPGAGRINGHGRIQVPVSVGGVKIRPGDVLVAGVSGVVVVPIERLEQLADELPARLEQELTTRTRLLEGGTIGGLRLGEGKPAGGAG